MSKQRRRFTVLRVDLLLGIVTSLSFSLACASRAQVPLESQTPMVVLRPMGRADARVRVELARTDPERARGLMFRDRLAEDGGMLFVFPTEEQQTFWMKNTYIPLDMIFIAADRHVLGVVERAQPLTETPRSVPGRSKYVLEVNGGYAARHGIGPGTPVELQHVE